MVENIINMFVFSTVAFGFMYLGKFLMDMTVKSVYNPDLEMEKENNLAVSIRRAGFYLGIAIAMVATMNGKTTLLENILSQVMNGGMILLFLFTATLINDKVLLAGVDNRQELKKKNVSVGIMEASLYISTALIASGASAGEGTLLSGLVFFILGQILLIAIGRGYELIHKDTFHRIKEGNISSGILIGGVIIAYALILRNAVSGNFVSWEADLTAFAISAIVGLVMLVIFANKAIDNFFIPTSSISQEIAEDNYAIVLKIASIKIAVAVIISSVAI